MLFEFLADLRQSLTGYVPEHRRLHDEFSHYDGDRWYYNDVFHNVSCPYFRDRAEKIRLLFNDDLLARLDNCPFAAELGLARRERDRGYKYCAFVYAVPEEATVAEIEAWALARGFTQASRLGASGVH